jgi:dihydrofolate synthase/folylpolyglutamate synthase
MPIASLPDAERYLDGFINRERVASFDYKKLGLGRIRALCEAIGQPQAGLPCVHITGSKGKGSTALATEVLLRAAGLRVGTFTSPHLVTWRERFRIDGAPVDEALLIETLADLQPALERLRADSELCPSFFDVTTGLALEIFRRAQVEAGVFEVGIGGRLDSTNVVESRVSVLTTVELEHTDKLGDTTEAIGGEKAGIMRKGVPFLHGALDSGAFAAVLAHAVAEDTPLEQVVPREVRATAQGVTFSLDDGRCLQSAVLGVHQAENLALAVRAAEIFLGEPLKPDALAALRTLELPARLERVGDVIVDCAHTRNSARGLRLALEALWPERRWVLALSLNRDKDVPAVLQELATSARACVLAHAEPVRALPTDELASLARAAGIAHVECCDDPLDAVVRARSLLRNGELLVVTGSIYFAGAVRDALLDSARST